ncbi:UPF0481 protein [Vigna angularis]|uniref:UPF0481 protein n=1 Tax=Phaseolus angularis TaxID=3914 RepID=A0A8T0L3L3_PHAAN|nr:UPF0481 protein [Vigna angularis]
MDMEEEANDHHTIDIWKVIDRERLASMELKISENPKLLSKSAGKRSCCIFRVPQSLIEANGKAYQPRIVSIGPYHRAQPRLNMIEEHKWRYLGSLLNRTKTKGFGLDDLFKALAPLESKARECYSETIPLDSHDFIQMMILDGCFIVELFRKVVGLVPFERDDPLVTMAWILPFFYRDFLKLENQIPFFVLNQLFQVTKLPGEKSTWNLSTLAMMFFNNSLQRPDDVSGWANVNGKHLLDLVRSSFIPNHAETREPRKRFTTPTHVIHCVSKLQLEIDGKWGKQPKYSHEGSFEKPVIEENGNEENEHRFNYTDTSPPESFGQLRSAIKERHEFNSIFGNSISDDFEKGSPMASDGGSDSDTDSGSTSDSKREGCILTPMKENVLPPVTVNFQQGLGQRFKQPARTGIDFSIFEESELLNAGDDDIYLIAIKADASTSDLDESKSNETPSYGNTNSQITQVVFEKDKGEFQAMTVKVDVVMAVGGGGRCSVEE